MISFMNLINSEEIIVNHNLVSGLYTQLLLLFFIEATDSWAL